MTRQAALEIVDEMEKRYLDAPHPGDSKESIKFFEQKANLLKWSVAFTLELSSLLEWARIFYSPRKWQKYPAIASSLHQSIVRVRLRIRMAPESSFQ
jgi:hypothetical protein